MAAMESGYVFLWQQRLKAIMPMLVALVGPKSRK
jgi:hypothetical protein